MSSAPVYARATPARQVKGGAELAHQKCQNFDTSCRQQQPFYRQARIGTDSCYVSSDSRQSALPGNYMLQNYYACDCGTGAAESIALSQPQTQYRDGYGYVGQGGCKVNNDSSLRNGRQLTHDKAPQQLFERPYLTVPYMGRGVGDPCTENNLQEGEDTSQKRQCNNLAGVVIPHQFTPLVPCLQRNIQDPIHIVPEVNREDWIRGGYPSRQWIKNTWYCRRCQNTDFCRCYQKAIKCPGVQKFK